MPITINIQAYVFLWSVAGGMVMAFIYDIFRIKRKAIRTRNIIIYLEDFIYWMIVALVMFLVVYISNEGEIRGYVLVGTIIGVILYILLLSRIIVGSSLFVIRMVSMVLKKLWMIATYPVRLVFRILRTPARFLRKKTVKLLRGAKHMGRNRISRMRQWRKIFRNSRKKI